MSTFAIRRKSEPKIWLWCRGSPEKFEVINGGWEGSIDENGKVHEHKYKGVFDGCWVAWKGNCPFNDAEYNEAIDWIEKQLSAHL